MAQSISDILSTPKGSRVMRRDYGSDLPRLLDAPMNGETQVDVFAAAAEALALWEPRMRLIRVSIAAATAGKVDLLLVGETLAGQTELTLNLGGA